MQDFGAGAGRVSTMGVLSDMRVGAWRCATASRCRKADHLNGKQSACISTEMFKWYCTVWKAAIVRNGRLSSGGGRITILKLPSRFGGLGNSNQSQHMPDATPVAV